jgi:hypothetical protein
LDFVVIGAFAAILHGSSRVTRDLDVCALLEASAVDLTSVVTGVSGLSAVAGDAVEAAIFGDVYKVLSLDNLSKPKQALRRDKDLMMERELLAIKAKLDAQK